MTKCELNVTLMQHIKPIFNASWLPVKSLTYKVASATKKKTQHGIQFICRMEFNFS